MTLGNLVKQYRDENKMSMDEFAKRSGLSKGYISMLENNVNPKNGKPIVPSLQTIKSVSIVIGIDVNEIISILDGNQKVSLNINDSQNNMLNTINTDDKEEYIRHLIQLKGESIKSFAQSINMPYTTLLSMLKNGLGGAAVDNVIKVCQGLNITIDELQNNTSTSKEKILSNYEKSILNECDKLNNIGKQEALKRVEELTHIEKYSTCVNKNEIEKELERYRLELEDEQKEKTLSVSEKSNTQNVVKKAN